MEKKISFPLKIKIKNEDLNKTNWLKDYLSDKNINIEEILNYEETNKTCLNVGPLILSTDKSDTDPNIKMQNDSNEMKNFRIELKQIVSSQANDKQASLINAGHMAKATNNVTSKTCLLS